MKEIDLASFTDYEDAITWLDDKMFRIWSDDKTTTEEVKGEISFVNGQFRVGVIKLSSQMELEV